MWQITISKKFVSARFLFIFSIVEISSIFREVEKCNIISSSSSRYRLGMFGFENDKSRTAKCLVLDSRDLEYFPEVEKCNIISSSSSK